MGGYTPTKLSAMRTAIVSTFPPRPCGIGTFAADLRGTLTATGTIKVADLVAVVHEPSSPQRRGLLATITQAVRGDYVRTARMLGRLDVDVVLLQHEYGIFGGRDGEYVLSFAQELAQPLVVTLHTVLSEPTPHQAEVLTELCAEAELVIVMTDTALRLLVGSGACPEEKVRVVPHGVPARITARAASDREARVPSPSAGGDTFQLSTFGLISPGKSLETVIEALPAMIERHPEILYTIAGQTHPDVSHREGERYRLMLERHVLELGLGAHVEFDDRFLSIDELSDLLAATDVFVTPYGNQEQIASGALTYAIAAGCAVVSTPYWYAQDMLASGAGLVVPFRDSDALADAVCRYVERPHELVAARAEAQRIGSSLAWPAVAQATALVLQEAGELAPRRRPVGVADLHLTSLRTDHLLTLADDVGIVQHAHGIIPNRDSGYCVDDVARFAVRLARACRARQRAALDIESLPCTRLPPRGDRRRRDAQLYDLRPALARRAARRRSRGPVDLGARIHLGHGVGPCRRAARGRPPRSSRWNAHGRGLSANGRVHRARALPPRRGPARARGPPASRAVCRPTRRRIRAHRNGGLALVRRRAQLRQCAAFAGTPHRCNRAWSA